MEIHCRNEYSFRNGGSLWIIPAGSVTLYGHNDKERLVYWFPWNWALLVCIFPVILWALVKRARETNEKEQGRCAVYYAINFAIGMKVNAGNAQKLH